MHTLTHAAFAFASSLPLRSHCQQVNRCIDDRSLCLSSLFSPLFSPHACGRWTKNTSNQSLDRITSANIHSLLLSNSRFTLLSSCSRSLLLFLSSPLVIRSSDARVLFFSSSLHRTRFLSLLFMYTWLQVHNSSDCTGLDALHLNPLVWCKLLHLNPLFPLPLPLSHRYRLSHCRLSHEKSEGRLKKAKTTFKSIK